MQDNLTKGCRQLESDLSALRASHSYVLVLPLSFCPSLFCLPSILTSLLRCYYYFHYRYCSKACLDHIEVLKAEHLTEITRNAEYVFLSVSLFALN